MITSLRDWAWAIDYSNAPGQKEAQIAPLIFKNRDAARKYNAKNFPKGKVVNIVGIRTK